MNQIDNRIIGGMKNEPNGGFLPIYVCTKESTEEVSDDEIQKREYKSPIKAISIKTLIEKRREKNPLISASSK
ncbi:hypothetical protein Indivirus_3_25 [Indivirus ILV1]|uniref:Uncharacterized protein n=1 Tax=Indivirus ILV1 TaxID=1977633 RepID=A0A1V0SDI6_9VIRU|nr:hypothetical protein Indivirus_3_25 [Indivirus ILV1]